MDAIEAFASLLVERPREPWHIDPRDKSPDSEETRQRAFLSKLANYGSATLRWSVPNAAKRTPWAIQKAKREGLMPGALDLTITWRVRRCAFIEFKNGHEMPSEDQMDVLDTLYRQGHHCGVFRSWRTAIPWLRARGAPISEIDDREQK